MCSDRLNQNKNRRKREGGLHVWCNRSAQSAHNLTLAALPAGDARDAGAEAAGDAVNRRFDGDFAAESGGGGGTKSSSSSSGGSVVGSGGGTSCVPSSEEADALSAALPATATKDPRIEGSRAEPYVTSSVTSCWPWAAATGASSRT